MSTSSSVAATNQCVRYAKSNPKAEPTRPTVYATIPTACSAHATHVDPNHATGMLTYSSMSSMLGHQLTSSV